MIKITQKESNREANTNSGRNLSKQKSQQRLIFRRIFCCSNRKVQTNKVWKLAGACAQEILDQKDVLRIFTNFYGAVQKSVLGQQLPQILPSSH
jgi:hypothetical protein